MSIVTLAEAKLHLRVDTDDEDTTIQIYLDASEVSAANYLNRVIYATDVGTDTSGVLMNAAIKAAILLQCGHLYANRESVSMAAGNYMIEMPMGVKFMLDPYRIELGV